MNIKKMIKRYLHKILSYSRLYIYKIILRDKYRAKLQSSYVFEIYFNRGNQKIYAISPQNTIIKEYECRNEVVMGFNASGDPYEPLPTGVYYNIKALIINGSCGPSYGNFYIKTGDKRGRDIHGGGNDISINNPYADYQGWYPTFGCLRMQNRDGVELAKIIIESDSKIILRVE